MLGIHASAAVRPPAVAGSFYPGDRTALERTVRDLLAAAGGSGPTPVALIAPHAGYVYSGATAARGFAGLTGAAVTRVVVLGPSHHTGFAGGALPAEAVTAFATPLGEMPLDTAAITSLRAGPEFAGPPRAHDREHSLEVQLPFIQATAGSVPLVPVVVGAATDAHLARAMARRLAALAGPGTVFVVSSDFTHHGRGYGYAPFPSDRDLPRRLAEIATSEAERAAAIDPRGFRQQVDVAEDTVCGVRPIDVLLELLVGAFEGQGRVVGLTTSAETSGTFDQVVTYVAVSYSGRWIGWRNPAPPPALGRLDAGEQRAVVELARATLATHLTHDAQLARWFAGHPPAGNLLADAGVFVTVNNRGAKAAREGRLRGCIGVIEAREPLVDAVVRSAVSAAHDPRFAALRGDELPEVTVEVSVLSPMHRVAAPEDIVLGTHGVLLGKEGRHAVFLPQVATETGWDRDTFLTQLARKAGLAGDAWRRGATFEVFTAQIAHEPE